MSARIRKTEKSATENTQIRESELSLSIHQNAFKFKKEYMKNLIKIAKEGGIARVLVCSMPPYI